MTWHMLKWVGLGLGALILVILVGGVIQFRHQLKKAFPTPEDDGK